MGFISVKKKLPEPNKPVIGLAKLLLEELKDEDPVAFEVEYSGKKKGFTDWWCEGSELDGEWKIIARMEKPEFTDE